MWQLYELNILCSQLTLIISTAEKLLKWLAINTHLDNLRWGDYKRVTYYNNYFISSNYTRVSRVLNLAFYVFSQNLFIAYNLWKVFSHCALSQVSINDKISWHYVQTVKCRTLFYFRLSLSNKFLAKFCVLVG